jgi:ketosteroid isomerase-like protein
MTDAEAIRGFFEHLNRSEFDPLEQALREDVVFTFPGRRFGGRYEGRRRAMLFLRANQRLFRDGLRFTVHWAARCGDRAVAQWTNAGTTREGSAYANRGATVFRLDEDGRIAEIDDYLDTEAVAEAWPS